MRIQNRTLFQTALLLFIALSFVAGLDSAQGSISTSPLPAHLLKKTKRPTAPKNPRVPIERNHDVERWIQFYSKNDRDRFDRFMTRGGVYKTMIQKTLKAHGVPPELYFLAMIESGFARKARSHAQAVGIWQFIKPTAKMYGLRVDNEVDERMDVIRSTEAAARYLKDLHREFKSWYLVMAAYNAGSGRISRAIKKGGTRDFWTLARKGYIPKETANYIPKFQAARIIALNPTKYGFGPKTYYEYPRLKRERMPSRIRLAEVARRTQQPVGTLRALNPHLLSNKVPKSRRGYDIWIPDSRRL